MDIGIITTITTIITIIMTGAFALVVVNQKTLRDSRDDQRARIEILENEREADQKSHAEGMSRMQTALEACQAAAHSKDAQIDAIGKIVTGEAHLVVIEHMVEDHAHHAETWMATSTEALTEIKAVLSELLTVTKGGQS